MTALSVWRGERVLRTGVAKTSVFETANRPVVGNDGFRVLTPLRLSQNRVSESMSHYLHSALSFETMKAC